MTARAQAIGANPSAGAISDMTLPPQRWARRVALLALVGGAMALQACSTLFPPPAGPGWTAGRMLVRVDAAPGRAAQSVSAAFELRGDSRQGELRLNSPLGLRVATAVWSSRDVQLSTVQGTQRFDSLDQLSTQVFGESLPLAALPDWLAGRAWPQAPHSLNPQGFEQLGWQVDSTRRSEGRIDARRTAAPGALLRVVLDDPA